MCNGNRPTAAFKSRRDNMNTLGLGKNHPISEKYDLAVFVGRFSPFTLAHKSIVDLAFKHANNVLVLVGSANAPRSHRNPFTYDERVDMIFNSMGSAPLNLYCQPLEDSLYNNDKWIFDAQTAVENCLDDIAENEGMKCS